MIRPTQFGLQRHSRMAFSCISLYFSDKNGEARFLLFTYSAEMHLSGVERDAMNQELLSEIVPDGLEEHLPDLVRFARSLARNAEWADDIAQKTNPFSKEPRMKRSISRGMFLTAILLIAPIALVGQVKEQPKNAPQNSVTEVTDGPTIKVYRLRLTAASSAQQTLQSLVETDPNVKIKVMVDERSNSLIVLATQELQERVAKFIETIDKTSQEKQARVVHFVAKVIMDAKEGDWTSQAEKPDQATISTLGELKELGIFSGFADPRIVANGVVRIRANGQNFRLQSSASDDVFRFSLNGLLQENGVNEFALNCKFVIEEQSKEKVHSNQIESDTTLSADHPVLLSVNTIDGRNCMIIVEVR